MGFAGHWRFFRNKKKLHVTPSYIEIWIQNSDEFAPEQSCLVIQHPLLQFIYSFFFQECEFFPLCFQVDAHVKALKILCKRKATRAEEGEALVLKWAHQLLSKALEILDSYVSEMSESGKVNSFFTPQNSRQKEKRDASLSKSTIKAVTAAFTIGSLILVCPSADLQGIVPVLHSIITSGSSEQKPRKLAGLTFSFKDTAPLLYIQSWVAMGKICLANDKLAKHYIPLFVQV